MNILESNAIYFKPNIKLNKNFSEENFANDISLYIHIPFCESKCYFCGISTDFYNNNLIPNNYIEALRLELKYYFQNIVNRKRIKSIHIGGGTPSLLNYQQINYLIKTLDEEIGIDNLQEIVFEANPLSLSNEKLFVLSDSSKVTLNVGIQTFDEIVLNKINRNASKNTVIQTIASAKKMNFISVGIDLIAGLPNSTIESGNNDIYIAKELGINHIAVYPLWIDSDSVIGKNLEKFENEMITKKKKFLALNKYYEQLKNYGFNRYSIYHFSNQLKRTHLYGRHQMDGGDWIGIGAKAIGQVDGYLIENDYSVPKYISNCKEKGNSISNISKYSTTNLIAHKFLYALRVYPLNVNWLQSEFGDEIYYHLIKYINYFIKNGFLECNKENIYMTAKGIINLHKIESLVSNWENIE